MKKTGLPSLIKLIGPLLFIGLILLIYVIYSLLGPSKSIPKDRFITIPKGATGYQVLAKLQREDLLKSPITTKIYLKLFPKTFNAGLYKLNEHMNAVQILRTLSTPQGPAVYKKVSIPEGFSLKKIANRLESQGITSANTFLTYVRTQAKADFTNTYAFLKENPLDTLEGYLFPDTYYLSPASTPQQITHVMLQTFAGKIWPLWEAAPPTKGSPKQRFNFHQVLAMASIIEKEARVADEMPTISSVYYNRLAKKMRLQADPTVLYALGEPNKKRVLYKDLKNTNPYNTYRHYGIPPGPIASPGVAAMKASLSPKKTPYFFFVAQKNGRHTFTRTYREHLNVQR